MGVFKRNNSYWGRWKKGARDIRRSLRTSDWRVAQRRYRELDPFVHEYLMADLIKWWVEHKRDSERRKRLTIGGPGDDVTISFYDGYGRLLASSATSRTKFFMDISESTSRGVVGSFSCLLEGRRRFHMENGKFWTVWEGEMQG